LNWRGVDWQVPENALCHSGRRESGDPESRNTTEINVAGFRVRELRSRPGMTFQYPAS
jgi:hypothetical protein